MSLQVCSCGWSKITTYQFLRAHQKKKGCTPKGLRIPESEQFRFNRFVPMLTYLGPPISLTDPFMDILKSSTKSEQFSSRIMVLDDNLQNESQPRNNTSSNQEIIPSTDMSVRLPERTPSIGLVPQFIPLAALIQSEGVSPPVSPPPVAREADTPQMNQTSAGAGPHETTSVTLSGQAPSMFSGTQIFGKPTNPAKTETNVGMLNQTLFQIPPQVSETATRASTFSFGAQQNEFSNTSKPTSPPRIPVAREAETPQMTQEFTDTLPTGSNSNRDSGTCDNTSATQSSPTMSVTKISNNQTNPANKEVKTEATNQRLFETPQKFTDTATPARRLLDFSSGAKQNDLPNPFTPKSSPTIPEASEKETPQMTQACTEALQSGSDSDEDAGARETTNDLLFAFQTTLQVSEMATRASTVSFGAQQNVFPNTSKQTSQPRIPVAREAETPQMTQEFTDTLPTGSNSNRDSGTHDTTSAAQSSPTMSVTKISSNQTNPANKEVETEATNQTLFETPQKVADTTTAARPVLVFSTGAQQNVLPNPFTPRSPPKISEASKNATPQMNQGPKDGASETASVPFFGQTSSAFLGTQIFGNPKNPANTAVNTGMTDKTLYQTSPQVFGASTFPFGAQQNVFSNTSTPKSPPRIPKDGENDTPQKNQGPKDGACETASVLLSSQAPSMFSGTQIFGNPTNPANTEVNTGMTDKTLFQNSPQVFGTAPRASPFSFSGQQNLFSNTFTPMSPQRTPLAREAETPQMTQEFTDTLPTGSNSNRDSGTHDTTSAAQSSPMVSGTKISGNQTNPANKEVKTEAANQTLTETPQKVTDTATAARLFDFSTGAQQIKNLNIPTTMAQETVFRLKKKLTDKAKSYPNLYTGAPGEVACDFCTEPKLRAEKSCLMCVTSYCSTHLKNHSATQRLKGHKLVDPVGNLDERACLQHGRPLELFSRKGGRCICVLCMKKDQEVVPIEDEWNKKKAKLENIKLGLREKIEKRRTRIDEINESFMSCEDQLETEQRDIDAVFTAVMAFVKETYAAALQPIKDRRQLMEQEAKDIEEKLEAEIKQLERSISKLDDISALDDHILFLQTYSSLQDVDNIKDSPEGELDTSLSFGTMRKITNTMLESIQQELEKLTPIELQRIPKFTVDVTLDPTTAHKCLEISDDGKEVKDSGVNLKVPDSLERFDMHGSVLGLNKFNSGKSYWEVEVRNKTGWDLGVARSRANRKGKLSLTPDHGYWVTVHFDDDKYAALTVPPIALSLEDKPQTVGVFVDYEEGLVSFYNVTTKSHIYSFTGCSFSGEILPYFSPHVKTDNKNVYPLVISSLGNCEQELDL